jgi:hypothetical protein
MVKKRGGDVNGRGRRGGSRDVWLRFMVGAVVVAATVVVAGDRGTATAVVPGTVLARGKCTGGCGSVSDCSA